MTTTPFRYAGAKNKLLPIIMEHLNPLLEKHNNFADVFIGGGSVLLEVAKKYPKINLFANDKDALVASFWQIVAGTNCLNLNELLSMMETQPTIELFYKLREKPASNIVERAYRAIFMNRTCFSGILSSGPIGGKEQLSKYKIDCRYNFSKLKEKILECNKLLAGRTIIDNVDITNYSILNKDDCAVYCDAPYYIKGDMLYPEKMSKLQHEQLAGILQKRNNWVASYDNCKKIRDLYKDNVIIDLSARYCINGKKDSWKNKSELIILSK